MIKQINLTNAGIWVFFGGKFWREKKESGLGGLELFRSWPLVPESYMIH